MSDLDALVAARRRHPDVGQDGIRTLLLDRSEQRVTVDTAADDVDLGRAVEDQLDRFANEVRVFGDDYTNRTQTLTLFERTYARRPHRLFRVRTLEAQVAGK
jgi:hypothetical protein